MKLFLAILALLLPPTASAREHPDFVHIRGGVPVILKPDRAYILYRIPGTTQRLITAPAFLREVESASQLGNGVNVFGANPDRPVFKVGRDRTFLVEVRPGSYVLLGLSWWAAPAMNTCFCFGTVRFPAVAGVITDMGYILSDEIGTVSKIPELAGVTGGRLNISPDTARLAGAIRPYADGMPVPPLLVALPRVSADYRAVGRFPNRIAYAINRLAPMPGVLAYDEDRVIDLKAD